LPLFPPLEASRYLGSPEQFRSLLFGLRRPPALVHPLPGAPRIAALLPGFRQSRRLRVFADGFGRKLARFRPQVLAGSPARLEQLAQALKRGALRMPPPTHALLVLVRPDEPLLTEEQRWRLWSLFRVPVFQELVGFDGQVIAWECEAHCGLHLVEEAAIIEAAQTGATHPLLLTSLTDTVHPLIRLATAWSAYLTQRLCGCGQKGQRMLPASDGVRQSSPEQGRGETAARLAMKAVVC
ncbi:MAG: hypothetical protein ACPL88_13385, partial [Bryobacteraceae bacterium]